MKIVLDAAVVNSTLIESVLRRGKLYLEEMTSDIKTKSLNGESVISLEYDYILLNQWVEILQDYYDQNFDETGQIEPDRECLTYDEVTLLMSRIKQIATKTYSQSHDWVLDEQSQWDDLGRWDDSQTWSDSSGFQ